MPVPTKIAFETRYSDDSGVEFGVRYDATRTTYEVEIEAVNSVRLPADKLDWLIESLRSIRAIVEATPTPEGGG
jgi:hypothetical protein